MSLLSPERLARIAEIGSQIIGHASRLTTASEDYEGNRNLNLSAMGCSHAIDELLQERQQLLDHIEAREQQVKDALHSSLSPDLLPEDRGLFRMHVQEVKMAFNMGVKKVAARLGITLD